MVPFARIKRNWKLMVLVVMPMFAASPLLIGIIFKETALQYVTFTSTIAVVLMIVTAMAFSRSEKTTGPQSEGVVEYAILLTSLHIIGIVAFCLDGIPALKDISSASMLVFGLLLIVILVKFDALK